MLQILDRYLLRQIIVIFLVITGIGLTILSLGRLLHLFGLVANPNQALAHVGRMLVLLAPHYLSIALPAAFFFGILLTFGRMRRDGEYVAMLVSGRSLARLLVPVMLLAFALAALATVTLGYLNPHARYAYRALKDSVAEASLTAAVLGSTFIHADGLTFFAQRSVVGADGLQLGKVFVYQEDEDGGATVITGREGRLARGGDDTPILILDEGVRAEIAADQQSSDTLRFTGLSWPVIDDDAGYGPRGRDQRELTLTELWRARTTATATSEPNSAEIAAELSSRLVMIASLPVLPLLAIPLAIAGGPRVRRSGMLVGLIVLILYHETLNFGEAMAKRDLLAPAIGLWLPLVVLTLASTWCFVRAARGRTLLPGFGRMRTGSSDAPTDSPPKPVATA